MGLADAEEIWGYDQWPAVTPLIGQVDLCASALRRAVRSSVTTLLELNFMLSVTTSIFLVDKDSKWRAAIDTVQWSVRFYKD